jgi:hypothetical protein
MSDQAATPLTDGQPQMIGVDRDFARQLEQERVAFRDVLLRCYTAWSVGTDGAAPMQEARAILFPE